ncbi:IclR family transcriptional regulator [Microbacterium sp. RD1]|uniref:IclR family transcriptional regulator n=1 Tax=Microbacterium sp. RD1 TaxID=3457313 RepID=UPI003FA538F3
MSSDGGGSGQLLVLGKIRGILDSFSVEAPERTLAEIRHATGLPSSTAQRLVANMTDAGFLDRRDDRYRIGARMMHWAAPAAHGAEVHEVVQPILRRLRDETGETAAFYRGQREFRVCVAVAETRHALRRALRVGDVAPIHVGSSGRVLLAYDDDLAGDVLSQALEPLTDRTVTDPEVLRGLLAQTRADGYAITEGERETAAAGMSAPVFDGYGRTAGAISIMGPNFRMNPEVMTGWLETLLRSAEVATEMLGGRMPRNR